MAEAQRRFPREHALAMRKAAEVLSNTARGSFWFVPEAICKTYVLAVYDGQDPFLAIRRKWFGEHLGPYEGLANRTAKEWLAGVQRVAVEIPRASA